MKRKTYSVDGLLEWRVEIPAGRLHIGVEFTGGKISGFGTAPALYTTDDPVCQRAIEASSHFRLGRIKLHSEETLTPDTSSR